MTIINYPAPPDLTPEQRTIARQQQLIGQLIDAQMRMDKEYQERFAKLEQENVALRGDVERLKAKVYGRKRQQ